MSRRRFLRDAGVAGAVAAEALAAPSLADARKRKRRPRRKTVAVFGGGIAGLTAAHELAERGFDVTVYERRAWGGKARSTEVPNSAARGRKPLPGEHGWRTFFGFYENTIDTFRRIPSGSNANGVYDNLVAGPEFLAARDGGRRNLLVPFGANPAVGRDHGAQEVIDLIIGALLELDLPPQGAAHFAGRLAVFFSSCDARRVGEWENTTWAQFTAADAYGEDYRKILVNYLSEILQASKAEQTSTVFPGHFWEWIVYNLLRRNSNGEVFRFLDGPTNEALIDPWLRTLGHLGVRLRNHSELKRLVMRDGRVAAARVRHAHGVSTVLADWYVCALPVERARRLWNPAIRTADPQLARMWKLDTAWMNGIKFFLREPIRSARGVVAYTDSPWQLTSVTQAQFWPVDFAASYGDGTVRDCISVDISKWTVPGVLYGRAAEDCRPDEVAREVWEQLKRHLNDTGQAVLTDDLLHSYDIDPGMIRRNGRLISDDPLVLPTAGQRPDRPDVTTAIPNLMLAGDYLNSEWEVANMETASFNARRAANAILDRAGSYEPPAKVIRTYRPPEWEPLKKIDAERYARGQSNLLDADLTLDEVKALLGRHAHAA